MSVLILFSTFLFVDSIMSICAKTIACQQCDNYSRGRRGQEDFTREK